MDASAYRKLGSFFGLNKVENEAKRGKSIPTPSSVAPRKMQKKRRKHRVSSVWEDETGGPARLVLVVRGFPDRDVASDFCDWVVAGIVGDELKDGGAAIH